MTIPISIYDASGWYTTASNAKKKPIENVENVLFYNVHRIIGYIPLIGIVTGLIDTCIAFDRKTSMDPTTRVYLFVRGIFQMLGLGILFLIPDTIVSVHRHCCTAPIAQSSQ